MKDIAPYFWPFVFLVLSSPLAIICYKKARWLFELFCSTGFFCFGLTLVLYIQEDFSKSLLVSLSLFFFSMSASSFKDAWKILVQQMKNGKP